MNRCTLCTLSLSLVVYILCSAVQCTSVNILFVRKWVQHSSTPLDWIIIVLQHCAQQGSNVSFVSYCAYRTDTQTDTELFIAFTSPTRIHPIPSSTQVTTNCEMQQLNLIIIIQQSFLILPFVLEIPNSQDDENIHISNS